MSISKKHAQNKTDMIKASIIRAHVLESIDAEIADLKFNRTTAKQTNLIDAFGPAIQERQTYLGRLRKKYADMPMQDYLDINNVGTLILGDVQSLCDVMFAINTASATTTLKLVHVPVSIHDGDRIIVDLSKTYINTLSNEISKIINGEYKPSEPVKIYFPKEFCYDNFD